MYDFDDDTKVEDMKMWKHILAPCYWDIFKKYYNAYLSKDGASENRGPRKYQDVLDFRKMMKNKKERNIGVQTL